VKPATKTTPKPTPKKTLLAKASPRPEVRKAATPPEKKEAEESEEERAASELGKAITKAAAAREKSDKSASESSKTEKGTTMNKGKGEGGSGGGQGSGAGNPSAYSWYTKMLHDRFYSEWAQPTSVVPSGSKISALVRIRIEKDGRVSDFSLVRPSGNIVVDESVSAVAKRVTKVAPLPHGLGGEHYDVKINFEINLEH
jgi:TonB family protein